MIRCFEFSIALDKFGSPYPAFQIGSNRFDSYVDTEAVISGHASGLKILLTEAWHRYHIPLAVTECHLGCTREQQLRWFDQQWKVVSELNHSFPIVAITAWALLGAYDWNSLVTQKNDYYESGVFKFIKGKIVPTAMTHMIAMLSIGRKYTHPVLSGRGWWDTESTIYQDTRPIVIINGLIISHYFKYRFLDIISTDDTTDLHNLIVFHNAWAVIVVEPNEHAEIICAGINVIFLYIPDASDAGEAIDSLIDQWASVAYTNISTIKPCAISDISPHSLEMKPTNIAII